MAAMELHEALRSRRTIFDHTAEPVPDATLERALELALWAPNHKLTEPWRFTIAGPETVARLADIKARLARKKASHLPKERQEAIARTQADRVRAIPVLMAVSLVRAPGDAFREREDYAATMIAVHNLVLALWAEGIGCQLDTGGFTRDDETYDVLQIERDAQEIVAFVRIGYPAAVPRAQPRSTVAKVVRHLP